MYSTWPVTLLKSNSRSRWIHESRQQSEIGAAIFHDYSQLHGWSSKLVVRTTFSRYCADYTGFWCQNVFRSGWQCWCIAASTTLHLASDLQRVSHLNARRWLRSSTTSALVVSRTVRSTIGDRTFPATAASVWNSLSESVRSSTSLEVFRSRLKTELFAWSYSHD